MSEELTLTNINEGEPVKMFQNELRNVVDNILDIDTELKTKREITLKITAIPNPEDRHDVMFYTQCVSKLAPKRGVVTRASVGVDKVTGEVKCIQNSLPFED